MDDSTRVIEAAETIAAAIGRRDVEAIEPLLAPGFIHRTPGAGSTDARAFLEAIRNIPGDIIFVKLESIDVDIVDGGAMATGIQHAQVRIDGETIDDRRAFVDWFERHAGEWSIRLAVDMPAPAEASPEAERT